jgi:hypothetical protein
MNDKFQLSITAVSVVVLFWAMQTLARLPAQVDALETQVTRVETHDEDQDRRIGETEDDVKDIVAKLNSIAITSAKAADAAGYVKERWDRWETAELKSARGESGE